MGFLKLRELRGSFKEWGLLAATTIGAGIFSLPYVFIKGGWLTGLVYFGILSFIIIFSHQLYFLVLQKNHAEHRLLGLVEKNFGRRLFYFSFFGVVGGLLLALVVYLILGVSFMRLVFPALTQGGALTIFYLICSAPFVFKLRRLLGLEVGGGVLMIVIIVVVFLSAFPLKSVGAIPAVDLSNWYLPFGAILFSLAGWTAIEPIYEMRKKQSPGAHSKLYPLTLGTIVAVLVYLMFVAAMLGSGGEITEDTLSGLQNWPFWKLGLLGVLGLFAIWTSYLPIGLEVTNLLEKDLRWSRSVSLGLVLILPLALIAAGLDNFIEAVSLAGGVFLALQYVLILLVGRKALEFEGWRKLLINATVVVFCLAAAYEIYNFVIR